MDATMSVAMEVIGCQARLSRVELGHHSQRTVWPQSGHEIVSTGRSCTVPCLCSRITSRLRRFTGCLGRCGSKRNAPSRIRSASPSPSAWGADSRSPSMRSEVSIEGTRLVLVRLGALGAFDLRNGQARDCAGMRFETVIAVVDYQRRDHRSGRCGHLQRMVSRSVSPPTTRRYVRPA